MGSPSGFSWACFCTPFPAALLMPCLPGCPYSVRAATHCLRRTWPTAWTLRASGSAPFCGVRPVFRTSHTLPPACVADCLDPPGLRCQRCPRSCGVRPVIFGPYPVRASHCLRRAWQTAWTLRVCAVRLPCRLSPPPGAGFRPLFRTAAKAVAVFVGSGSPRLLRRRCVAARVHGSSSESRSLSGAAVPFSVSAASVLAAMPSSEWQASWSIYRRLRHRQLSRCAEGRFRGYACSGRNGDGVEKLGGRS